MRHLATFTLISWLAGAPALAAAPQAELRAAPNNVPLQMGYGCAIGGASGALLSLLGTVGTAALPATAFGCGVGAAAAPAAADFYERYRLQAAIFVNQALRPAANRALDYLEGWLDPSQ